MMGGLMLSDDEAAIVAADAEIKPATIQALYQRVVLDGHVLPLHEAVSSLNLTAEEARRAFRLAVLEFDAAVAGDTLFYVTPLEEALAAAFRATPLDVATHRAKGNAIVDEMLAILDGSLRGRDLKHRMEQSLDYYRDLPRGVWDVYLSIAVCYAHLEESVSVARYGLAKAKELMK